MNKNTVRYNKHVQIYLYKQVYSILPQFWTNAGDFFFSIYSVFWGRHMKTASSDYPEPAEVSSTQAILTHAPHLFCLASTLFIHPLIP